LEPLEQLEHLELLEFPEQPDELSRDTKLALRNGDRRVFLIFRFKRDDAVFLKESL
jgi:hypothetical protein